MQDAKMQDLIRLAPSMAHHVRDEVSVIQTATDFLINDKSISTEARNKLATIKGHLGHVAAIARQFLIITDTEASHLTVFDIRDVLSQLASILQRLLGEGSQLHMALDPNLWPIKADEDQFEQIFTTLVVNAGEAMPSGGTVSIRATNITKAECETKHESVPIAADYVLIEVADTGVGIPKGNVDRLFEPFFTTKGPGCGFGLATVYGTIRKINGHIIVESNLGKGTMFRIYLPRHFSTAKPS